MNSQAREPLAILSVVRTPFVRAFGQLLESSVDDLARFGFLEALSSARLVPSVVSEVILGCAGQPVEAMNVARVAALRAGVPERIPAFTVHRNCASGLEVIAQALLRVRAQDGGPFLIGGAESMSNAPFQMRRAATRTLAGLAKQKTAFGRLRVLTRVRLADALPRPTLVQALTDPVTGLLMGDTAEVLAREMGISREEQDRFASESHVRALAAVTVGKLREEIVPYLQIDRSGRARAIDSDDGPRSDAVPEKLARLRPVFDRRFGTVTVGNACQLTDGAAAMVVTSRERAAALGREPLGYVRDVVTVGCEPRRMGLGPAIAIPALLERNGLRTADIDLFEINEAFAVQVLACLKQLGADAPPLDRLNVNGGAIALGHPVGATGIRIVQTLLLELRRRRARRGIASLCVGGGQGVAVLVETTDESRSVS